MSKALSVDLRERVIAAIDEGMSCRIEGQAEVILGLLERKPDATLAEIEAALAERGVAASNSTIWRFFDRRGITLKKSRRTRTSKTVPTS